jgi:hypothetical protein
VILRQREAAPRTIRTIPKTISPTKITPPPPAWDVEITVWTIPAAIITRPIPRFALPVRC